MQGDIDFASSPIYASTKVWDACTLRNFRVHITENTVPATTLTIVVNGQETVLQCYQIAGTGWFSPIDADAFVNLVSGDIYCLKVQTGGTSAQSIKLASYSVDVSGPSWIQQASMAPGPALSISGYYAIDGMLDWNIDPEIAARKVSQAVTYDHLRVVFETHTAADTYLRTKIRRAGTEYFLDGNLEVRITAGQVGAFESTGGADILSPGDEICWQFTGGGGEITLIQMRAVSECTQWMWENISKAADPLFTPVSYVALSGPGYPKETNESKTQMFFTQPMLAKNMVVRMHPNDNATSIITLRINGQPSEMTMTIGPGETIKQLPISVPINAGEMLNWEIKYVSGSGFSPAYIGVDMQSSVGILNLEATPENTTVIITRI
jgi:hypothetical protein